MHETDAKTKRKTASKTTSSGLKGTPHKYTSKISTSTSTIWKEGMHRTDFSQSKQKRNPQISPLNSRRRLIFGHVTQLLISFNWFKN